MLLWFQTVLFKNLFIDNCNCKHLFNRILADQNNNDSEFVLNTDIVLIYSIHYNFLWDKTSIKQVLLIHF